jgi:hypothetical protein
MINPTELAFSCMSEYVSRNCPHTTKEELKNAISLLSNLVIRIDSKLKVSESNLEAYKKRIESLESFNEDLISPINTSSLKIM